MFSNKNSNNKHDWIKDHERIDPLQIEVKVQPDETIIDFIEQATDAYEDSLLDAISNPYIYEKKVHSIKHIKNISNFLILEWRIDNTSVRRNLV
jgi:hypothetical protein